MTSRTYVQYLLDVGRSGEQHGEFAHILSAVAVMVKQTAGMLSRGSLILDQLPRSTPRSAKEVNRGVRRLATRALFAHTEQVEQLAAISLSGDPAIYPVSESGRYLLLFEALHGLGNLIDNMTVGTAFSILERQSDSGAVTEADFLQPGSRQVSAGIALFGPRTVMLVTTGHGVDEFTLDRELGNFMLTRSQVTIPASAGVFSINAADSPHWPGPVKRYVDECVQGEQGPRGQGFSMRWNASALVGAFRVLNSGGLFLIPDTGQPTGWRAPLLHNAAPLALLAEQAGGRSSTGTQRVLDVTPTSLDARTPYFLGSTSEVERIERYFAEHEQGQDAQPSYPLFHNRGLFVD